MTKTKKLPLRNLPGLMSRGQLVTVASKALKVALMAFESFSRKMKVVGLNLYWEGWNLGIGGGQVCSGSS